MTTPAAPNTAVPTHADLAARARTLLSRGLAQAAVLRALTPDASQCDPPMTLTRLAEIIGEQAAAGARARRVGIIAAPLETTTLTGRRYAWGPLADDRPGVTVTVERINPTRSALLAEVTIDAGDVRLHGPVITDIMSTSNQAGLARYLAGLYPMNAWPDIVGAFCRLAVEAHRTGAPVVRMAEPIPPDAGGYAVDPLIPVGPDATMLFARGGSGKSILALAIAAALDGALGVLPLRTLARHRVAYLDWEWSRAPHYRRLSAMLTAEELAACGILYRRMSGGLPSQVDQLARMIAEEGVTYLVIDSIGTAAGDDPEKAGTALRFADAVRALGLGSLWVTHIPKHAPADTDSPFGSTYWRDAVRSAWRVDCNSEPNDPVMRLALHHCKVNEGQRCDPVGLAIAFGGGRIEVRSLDVARDAVLQQTITPQKRIRGELTRAGHALDVAELARLTGLEARDVEGQLKKLEAQRAVMQLTSGKWGLASPGAGRQNGHAAQAIGGTQDDIPL